MIVEYLSQQNLLAGDERMQFTVNTAAVPPEVPLLPPTLPLRAYLRNSSGYKYFAPDDNFRLLSVGLWLPYSFQLSTRTATCLGIWEDAIAGTGPISELTGSGNKLDIPFDGSEFPLDITIEHKSPGIKTAYLLELVVGAPLAVVNISMVNVPASLNALVLRAAFFVKILHNLPMIA